jgi:hypothetical protein
MGIRWRKGFAWAGKDSAFNSQLFMQLGKTLKPQH